jgi:hypothetical protein
MHCDVATFMTSNCEQTLASSDIAAAPAVSSKIVRPPSSSKCARASKVCLSAARISANTKPKYTATPTSNAAIARVTPASGKGSACNISHAAIPAIKPSSKRRR